MPASRTSETESETAVPTTGKQTSDPETSPTPSKATEGGEPTPASSEAHQDQIEEGPTSAGDSPKFDPQTTAVSDTVAPPGADYSQEQLNDLAYGLKRAAPFFLGADVRSDEASKTVAKVVLETLVSVGFSFPEMSAEARNLKEESEDPEKANKAAEKEMHKAQAEEKKNQENEGRSQQDRERQARQDKEDRDKESEKSQQESSSSSGSSSSGKSSSSASAATTSKNS